jgi:hypothetical protein
MSPLGFHPRTAAAALLALITAGALCGCSRPEPLSPVRSRDAARAAESPAVLSPDSDEPARPQGTAANLDPELQITLPRPSALFMAIVPQTFTLRWEASDPDARSNRPLEYRYLLLDDEFEFNVFIADPDSLVRRDGPGFTNWTRIQGSKTELELRDLELNRTHLLAIVAIDEQGAFNRVFSLNTNMLRFVPGHPASLGPLLHVSGGIEYQPFTGGRLDDPATAPHFVVPMEPALAIHWTARAFPGDMLNGTRWALDPTKFDDTSHGAGREGGWSGWSLTDATASVGPFATQGEHRLYIEARTELGTFTRLLMILDVVPPTEVARARGQ